MADTPDIMIWIVITGVFIWRFERTRQIYLRSLSAGPAFAGASSFIPPDIRSFIEQALLGRRSLSPGSFFIRAVLFLLVAISLLPFKVYDPNLYWYVLILIAGYVLWCCLLGIMLKGRLSAY